MQPEIACQQLALPGWEIQCANPRCTTLFPYDRRQPAKRFCSERCRIAVNNELILTRAGGRKHEGFDLVDADTIDTDQWTALACFAGGSLERSAVYLEQYRRAVKHKRNANDEEE